VAFVAQSIRSLIYSLSDWRIGGPFAVEFHPGFCEADRGTYLFGDKNGPGMTTHFHIVPDVWRD